MCQAYGGVPGEGSVVEANAASLNTSREVMADWEAVVLIRRALIAAHGYEGMDWGSARGFTRATARLTRRIFSKPTRALHLLT